MPKLPAPLSCLVIAVWRIISNACLLTECSSLPLLSMFILVCIICTILRNYATTHLAPPTCHLMFAEYLEDRAYCSLRQQTANKIRSNENRPRIEAKGEQLLQSYVPQYRRHVCFTFNERLLSGIVPLGLLSYWLIVSRLE